MRPTFKIALVLLAVLLVIGLFLPVVSRIRGISRRIQCANNLRQIALAVDNYCDSYSGKFPPGTRPSKDLPPEKRLSWLFEIAPFIESNDIYSRTSKDEAWDAPSNQHLCEAYSPYMCPSVPGSTPEYLSGMTPYVGIAGVGKDAPTLALGDENVGIFGFDRQVRVADVKDGRSFTFLAMETTLENGHWAAGGHATIRGLDPDDRPYFGDGRPFGGLHIDGPSFFSRRLPSCNIAIADGSVRAGRNDIDPRVFKAGATIAGGDDFSGSDW